MRMPTARNGSEKVAGLPVASDINMGRAMKAKRSSTLVKAILPINKLIDDVGSTAKLRRANASKSAKQVKVMDMEEMLPSGTECVFRSVEHNTERTRTMGKQHSAKKIAAEGKKPLPKEKEKPSPKEAERASEHLHAKKMVGKRKPNDFLSGKPPRVSVIQAATIENPTKKIKVKPQEEKSLAAERKLALMALELTDLDDLLQGDSRKGEPVSEKVTRIKDDMAAKSLPELKELCNGKSLKVGGAKGDLVKRLLEHAKDELKVSMVQAILDFEANARKEFTADEAKARDEARAQASKVRQVVSTSKADVASKSGEELNQLLTNYGLKLGGTHDEKVERIVFAKMLAAMARDVRKQEMLSMSADNLLDMCSKAKDVFNDRLVREVMVDRLLLCEQ